MATIPTPPSPGAVVFRVTAAIAECAAPSYFYPLQVSHPPNITTNHTSMLHVISSPPQCRFQPADPDFHDPHLVGVSIVFPPLFNKDVVVVGRARGCDPQAPAPSPTRTIRVARWRGGAHPQLSWLVVWMRFHLPTTSSHPQGCYLGSPVEWGLVSLSQIALLLPAFTALVLPGRCVVCCESCSAVPPSNHPITRAQAA